MRKTILTQILEDDFEHIDDLLMWVREYGLNEEKQQIIEAWQNGAAETVKERISVNKLHPPLKHETAENYYTENYGA